ncbi:MEDS domain-containing protein [Actinoplanes sp. NPDC020271]|uniref:MEDS domain-containing protein n=1 Tax=Actinoplanes sp. NPDC020271 TaxID=3363896 RepID=UPI0037A1EE69
MTRTTPDLQLGDHLCVIVGSDEEKAAALAGYVRDGLRDNHRILYYGDPAELLDPEWAAALAAGQLQVTPPERSYLASGRFDPEATIAGWEQACADARASGHDGLRVAGDMSWAARPVPGAERLPWYEAQVNRVFAGGYSMAVCFYDRRLFTAAQLRGFACAHPTPRLRMIRTEDPAGLRVQGETDATSRAALRAVVENLADDLPCDETLVIDVSRLRFADASAARTLLHPAAVAGRRTRLVGCSPGLRRLLAFHGADDLPGLTVETGAVLTVESRA